MGPARYAVDPAAMEPGRRDREQGRHGARHVQPGGVPQWSPVDVTGNRGRQDDEASQRLLRPQWSPVDVTGNSW